LLFHTSAIYAGNAFTLLVFDADSVEGEPTPV
jgi:hypothetical protein